MANGLPIAKTSIGYNNNCYEEIEEERKTIYIEFTKQNADSENAIDFRWSDVQEEDEEDIALVYLIEITKASWWRKFIIKVTGWLRYRT